MTWKFEPALSSADYLELARKRERGAKRKLRREFQWMLNERFDFGVNNEHVDMLLNPAGWSKLVIEEQRKPRVFIGAYVNQRGNVEIRWAGRHDILFDEDFLPPYLEAARSTNPAPFRSLGELMWIDGFDGLVYESVTRKCPVAKALMFGFKARIGELLQTISAGVDLLGATEMEFGYTWKALSSVDFEPNIPPDQFAAYVDEGTRRQRAWVMKEFRKFEPQGNKKRE